MTAINASNTPRSLDAIGADLRKLRNIFDSGKLLTEADDACEHGEWLPWLETYFDASADTARRHMAAYRLSLKYCMVRDLKVPPTVFYQLADLDFKFDDDSDDLPTIIDALAKATKDKTKLITVAEADQVIDLTALRIDFGDYPTATLHALRNMPPDVEWAAGASKELKKAQPDSGEAADKIVLAFRRKRLEELFGGALPDRLGEMALDWLEDVEPERRQQVLAMLNEDASLDWRQVADIIDDDQDDDAETAQSTDEQDDDGRPTEPGHFYDPDFLDALRVILHHARRPMPTSIGGISGAELVEAARFLDKLHELATGGSTVKRIADRAEARSRNGRSAACDETTASSTDRWIES
jgi:Protein of unknown function (DUF3102)